MNAAFVRLLHLFDQLGVLEVQPADLEWVDQETLARLTELGFFVPAGARTTYICGECERRCEKRPRQRQREGGTSLEVVCRSIDLILDVDPRQLEVWRFSPEAVGRWLARSLNLTGHSAWQGEGILRLGERRIDGNRREFFFLPSLRSAEQSWTLKPPELPKMGVLLTGSAASRLELRFPGTANVAVEHLLDFSATIPRLDPRLVQSALGFKSPPPRTRKLWAPAGTPWEQVKFRVSDSKTVQVSIGNLTAEMNPDDFGLAALRGQERNVRKEWTLLLELANARGRLAVRAVPTGAGFRQELHRLREALRSTLGIDDDPFLPRDAGECFCRFDIRRWDDDEMPRPWLTSSL